MLATLDGIRIPQALWTLLDATIRSSLILLLAAGVAMLLRKRSAAWRHGVWASAIVLALLLPAFSAMLPAWRLSVLPESVLSSESSTTVSYHLVLAADDDVISDTTGAQQDHSLAVSQLDDKSLAAASETPDKTSLLAAIRDIPASTWILIVWAIGAAAVVTPLLIGTINIRRIARKARRLIDGDAPALRDRLCKDFAIRRPVSLLQSEDSLVPVTWGIWRPTVLLPREAGLWSADRLRMVLLHELAHVRRKDCLIQLLSQLAQAMYWFNPLVWWVAWNLRIQRERACDDLVLAGGAKAPDYADQLLQIVRSLRSVRNPSLAAVAMARKSQFESRMLSILDETQRRNRPSRRAGWAIAAVALAVAAPLAALQPVAQAQDAQATQPVHGNVVYGTTYVVTQVDSSTETKPANRRDLLDEETRKDVTKIDRMFASWFRPESRYDLASAAQKEQMIQQWIKEAQSDDFKTRTRAIAALGNVKAQPAVETLIRIAEEPMGNNRPKWLAVRALGEIGDRKAVPTLIGLVDYGNWNTHVYARTALAEITGVYFGKDKDKWAQWWKEHGQAAQTTYVVTMSGTVTGICMSTRQVLSHVQDTPTSKRSLGGSGHAVKFTRSDDVDQVAEVMIYADRYGYPQPPKEDFKLYLLDQDRKVIREFPFPYSMIQRTGEMKWYTLKIEPTAVPKTFYVALSFNPHQTKGVYLGLDEKGTESHSFVGLPDQGYQPLEKGDWAVRAVLDKKNDTVTTLKANTIYGEVQTAPSGPRLVSTTPAAEARRIDVAVQVSAAPVAGNVLSQIVGVHLGTYPKAHAKGLNTNTHIYVANDRFHLQNGGLLTYWNETNKEIPGPIHLGNFGREKPDYLLFDEQNVEQAYELRERENPRYGLWWKPTQPVLPGAMRTLVYFNRRVRPLPIADGKAMLTMKNFYGSPVMENFFLVLPRSVRLASSDNSPTSTASVGNYQVILWQREVPANTENRVNAILTGVSKVSANLVVSKRPKMPVWVLHGWCLEEKKEFVVVNPEAGKRHEFMSDGILVMSPYTNRRTAVRMTLCPECQKFFLPESLKEIDPKKPPNQKDLVASMAKAKWICPYCGTDFIQWHREHRHYGTTVIKASPTSAPAEQALPAAEEWLKLVDDGQYGQSWDAAATYFRNAVAKDEWEKNIQAARAPLGKAKSRKALSTKYVTSLPGAPDGQYVVIQFSTAFENKKQATETVTPMKDKDGTWRVSGYYVK